MQAAKQIRLSRNALRSAALDRVRSSLSESIQRKQNSALRWIDGMFSDGGERRGPLGLVRHVGVQQGQVELHVHGFLEQLPGEVEPALGRVDVLVEVQHQVVRDDRVPGGEERDEPAHQVPLGAGQPGQVAEIGVQVDFLHRPGVPDRGPEPVVEVRVPHRPQGQLHARIEQQATFGRGPGRRVRLHCVCLHCVCLHCVCLHCVCLHCVCLHRVCLHRVCLHRVCLHRVRGHWQASQVSGFSSEHTTAAVSDPAGSGTSAAPGTSIDTVAWAIRVAGRERR